MSNDEDHSSAIAGIARQMLDDMANNGKQVTKQIINVVFGKGQLVTLRFSAVTVARDKTTLYLAPSDVETLITALQPKELPK